MNDTIAWEFDHFKVMTVLADIITEIVGTHIPTIPNSNGQKVFLAHYQALSGALPALSLNYEGSRDSDGYIIAKGLVNVEVEDPDNPPNTIEVVAPFIDKLINFNISIRCESMPPRGYDDKTNSHRLLREIRKGLLLPKHRKKLREEGYSALEFINTIRSTPDLIATSYHEICTMQLKLSTVDRLIDYDAMSFNTVDYQGILVDGDGDPDPTLVSGITTSLTP